MNSYRAFKLKLHTNEEPNKRHADQSPRSAVHSQTKNIPSYSSERTSLKVNPSHISFNDNTQQIATTNLRCTEKRSKRRLSEIGIDYVDRFFPETGDPLPERRIGSNQIVDQEQLETVPTIARVDGSTGLMDGINTLNTKVQHKYPWLTPPHSETSIEDQDSELDVSQSSEAKRVVSSGYPSPPQTDPWKTGEEAKMHNSEGANEVVKNEGNFQCTYCKRCFSYLCHLKVHERVHTGEKPYSCKYCTQQFSQLGSLTVHMRIHTGAKPYQCSKCSKKFRHVNSLRRHQRQVHNTKEHVEIKVVNTPEKPLVPKQYVFDAVKPDCLSPAKKTKKDFKPQGISLPRFEEQFKYEESAHKTSQYWSSVLGRTDANVTCGPPDVKPIHTSKFIQALEKKNEMGCSQRNPVVDAAETLISLAKEGKKAKTTTWRPFSTDDEDQQLHQVLVEGKNAGEYPTIKEKVHRQSWSSLGLTCSGNVLTNSDHKYDPIIREFARYGEIINSSRWYGNNNLMCSDRGVARPNGLCVGNDMDSVLRNVNVAGGRSCFNGQYFWPSALSLQCQLAPMPPFVPLQEPQLKEERALVSKQQKSITDRNPSTSDSEESTISIDGGTAKDDNSSDEGFLSSCSNAGKRRSSDSSMEENADAVSTHRLESSPKSAEKISKVRVITDVGRKNIFTTEDRGFDRKWSKDSGFGVYVKSELKAVA